MERFFRFFLKSNEAKEQDKSLRRVAVDLDDTLIKREYEGKKATPILRPGAEMFLRTLKEKKKLTVILYTASPQAWVDVVFETYPHLEKYFSEVYAEENKPRHNLEMIRDPKERKFLEDLDKGMYGGKDPALVQAAYLIDDGVSTIAQMRLGFTWIQVIPPYYDNTDAWAKEALQQLEQEMKNRK